MQKINIGFQKKKLMVLPFGSDIKPITKNEFLKLQKKELKIKKRA